MIGSECHSKQEQCKRVTRTQMAKLLNRVDDEWLLNDKELVLATDNGCSVETPGEDQTHYFNIFGTAAR